MGLIPVSGGSSCTILTSLNSFVGFLISEIVVFFWGRLGTLKKISKANLINYRIVYILWFSVKDRDFSCNFQLCVHI